MPWNPRRLLRPPIALLIGLAAGGELIGPRDDPPSNLPALSWDDPRLEPLREAAESWESRRGPIRQVVDQVCLVPDLPTLLAAVATWDRAHWFPVLIDEPESNLRFIKAFRPARVVRMPAVAAPMPGGRTWEAAVEAVASSRKPGADDPIDAGLGPTPPGVVLSNPESGALAGAVALAAGRFQPLLRWKPPIETKSVPKREDVLPSLLIDLERTLGAEVPNYGRLGDDCDFLTIAGDYPDRYEVNDGDQPGAYALDDLIGRRLDDATRWAFVGRILGGPSESCYSAMCALFLQPESALLFDGYAGRKGEWAPYGLKPAAEILRGRLDATLLDAASDVDLEGWRNAFAAPHRYGFVLANSSGGPNKFRLADKTAGLTADVPIGPPVFVSMIHSFSAARPEDVATIAGRWRANGAYLYLGSINEPYLQSFRAPALLVNLLTRGVPVAAAARKLLNEDVFGKPWRLIVLGDPLYRLDPEAARVPRLKAWGPTANWPAYSPTSPPSPGVGSDSARLGAALRLALATAGTTDGLDVDRLRTEVAKIRRSRLPEFYRSTYDALLAQVVVDGKARSPMVRAIPGSERSGSLRRAIDARTSADSTAETRRRSGP